MSATTSSARRIVVVGASTGLGRAVGIALAHRGEQVALLARSKDKLDTAAAEAGHGALAIACDVTDEQAVRSAIDEAAQGLGGIDGVVYSSGIGTLRRLVDLDSETWLSTFATNVVGANTVTAAALPYLEESGGVVAYFSSNSTSLTPPWPGLGSYLVSKAALDKLIEMWRAEHPHVGFTRVIVGPNGGGEGESVSQFTAGWDLELAGELFPLWAARGCLSLDDGLVNTDDFVDILHAVLRLGASATIPTVAVTPRPAPPAAGDAGAQDQAEATAGDDSMSERTAG
jgi:NAD(P)-dependent dehydrogenase (short-subunit alcohol dehydrogenase family)